MSFHFTCPYCFKKTLVDESLAGQSGPCASCGKTITIPGPPPKQPAVVRPVDRESIDVARSPEWRYLAWLLKIGALLAGVLILSSLAIYLLWPTFQGLKSRRDRVASLNNLQLIARALNEYALTYGSYPPPVVYDAAGKPMHSWRVLILEQLGEPALYAQYDFGAAWDAPQNVKLFARCPRVYISPTVGNPTGLSEANYVLMTGSGTIFPKSGPLRPADIGDGPQNTLLVVETDNQTNEWTKPWDIDVSKLNTKIGSSGPNSIGGNHDGGATGVFADGQPVWLPEDLSPVLLQSIISPNGGEPIDRDDYQWE
jgi:type II secretory pathway pseudopilin PulG